MDKQQLIDKYELGQRLSKSELGKLRRIVLQEKLEMITALDSHQVVAWLDGYQSKIIPKKLADAVGYGSTLGADPFLC